MSLYDDIEMEKTAPSGWASGLKLMPNQMAFKKASFAGTRRDQRRGNAKLPPVIDLKSRREDDDSTSPPVTTQMLLAAAGRTPVNPEPPVSVISGTIGQTDPEWRFTNEYHPLWPNDYEKVVRDMRERRDREEKEKRQQEREEREKKWRGQSNVSLGHEPGFSARPRDSDSEDEEEEERPKRATGVGAAIAPPSSLDAEAPVKPPVVGGAGSALTFNKFGGSSIAAKIMAKYGFREGQGLGKSEQGIVRALEVEKTSKRGGRIVTERDEGPPSPPAAGGGPIGTPPHAPQDDGFAAPMGPPPPPPKISGSDKPEPSIADILKSPSKVAVLRNMVGPGEVDDDLEPEVREECREKYGAVVQVLIFQIPRAPPHEAVRIFVEFQRVEAAIKAVIDLNGRFFGGRQVAAGFYDHANFKAFRLNEPIS